MYGGGGVFYVSKLIMELSNLRHIVVEGPIGAGKTTLSKQLGTHLNAQLVLEAPDENPFLSRFYREGKRWALSTQLFFLFQREQQLRGLMQRSLFERCVVSDFLFEKDPLFAKLTLSEEEFSLYTKIFAQMQPQAMYPDLVIYLQAPANVLSERILKRNHGAEASITSAYLEDLCQAYSLFFHDYVHAPLLIINTEHWNPQAYGFDFDRLIQQIEQMRGRRAFFSQRD